LLQKKTQIRSDGSFLFCNFCETEGAIKRETKRN